MQYNVSIHSLESLTKTIFRSRCRYKELYRSVCISLFKQTSLHIYILEVHTSTPFQIFLAPTLDIHSRGEHHHHEDNMYAVEESGKGDSIVRMLLLEYEYLPPTVVFEHWSRVLLFFRFTIPMVTFCAMDPSEES